MKTAVFGTGVVGQTIAQKLRETGHEVMVGTRNVADTMARHEQGAFGNPPFPVWHKQQADIGVGTFPEAAAFGEILFNCSHGKASLEVLRNAGEQNLNEKILIDIANPLDFSKGFPPSLTVCNTDSLAEQIQREFPQLKVVKTLNTMNSQVMTNPSLVPGDHTVFLSGNDGTAKKRVRDMLLSFGWKESSMIDLGDITTARGTEILLPVWVQLYGALQNPLFNFHIATATPPGR